MYKNANDVEAALAVPYNGPTKEKDGYTYIPAAQSQKALDRLFGPLGWSEEGPVITADPEHGVYVAAERIVARVIDESGEVREVGRVGFGRSTAQATREEREQHGLTVTRSLQIHDTAAAAAGTDAFSRACKKFGPALGSDLYVGEGTSSNRSSAPRAGGRDFRPSEKQLGILKKMGLTDEAIEAMPSSTWRAKLDDYFGKKSNAAPASDDLPF